MPILYALISREKTVLAEHTATSTSGNFPTVTRMLLSKIPKTDGKMTYVYDDFVFHYIVEAGICYLCMSDEKSKHRIPFAFLEDVKTEFSMKYGVEAPQTAIAFSMNEEFSPVIERRMDFFNSDEADRTIDNIGHVKSQIDEVKDAMVQNIERVLERGEKIELLVDKTDRLNQQAFRFEASSRSLRRAMYWRRIRCYIASGVIAVLVVYFASVSLCGFDYSHCTQCLAFPSEKDLDLMKAIEPFYDKRPSTNKRSSPDWSTADGKEGPKASVGTCDQAKGKRVRAASKPDGVVKTLKRQSYLTWDDYFLAITLLSSKRSKDPDSPSGACIVDKDNRVVAVGYNGFPKGCSDSLFPWHKGKSKTDLHSKEAYLCSSIANAITNKCSNDVVGCRLYVMSFPGSDDAKLIIQSRIEEVVLLQTGETTNTKEPSDDEQASRILLAMANVRVRFCQPSKRVITLDFSATLASNLSLETTPPPKDDANAILPRERKARQLLLEEAKYDVSTVQDNGKRKDFISWQDYFMAMAFLTAERSKDPNTQVGACIVDAENRIVGLGYNGFPRGCSDDNLPWARVNKSPLDNKYLFVCHAEVNAILNKGSANVRGSKIYVALFPCENCAKMIIQSGIREVVYMNDPYHDTDGARASRIMFQSANVVLTRYSPSMRQLVLDFNTTGQTNETSRKD